MSSDLRWKLRFNNFKRAIGLLGEALESGPDVLSDLEKEGVIQRFEYSFELAWKTMKDFLEDGGVEIVPLTPRQVIKESYAARVIEDGQVWINMLDQRNLLSHTYDHEVFVDAVIAISSVYLSVLKELEHFFDKEGLK